MQHSSDAKPSLFNKDPSEGLNLHSCIEGMEQVLTDEHAPNSKAHEYKHAQDISTIFVNSDLSLSLALYTM